ncbi:MAG TPA: IPT/TIG domain-containing protein [Bryobacteraceae bacterium]
MQHKGVSKKRLFRQGLITLVLAASCYSAGAQSPVIAAGGIVNAASYIQPVAPGSLVAIFGTNLAQSVQTAATISWPTTLGGTSVSINGIAAPLSYVSPNQINAQVPSSVPFSYGGYTTASVVVTTAVGSSAPATVSIFVEGPGVFTTDASGCGQAAALNIAPDGSFSPNSPSNSAAPGDFIAVFGTGSGQTYFAPSDGTPASGAQRLEDAGGFAMNGKAILPLGYFGLAPDLVGLNQANVQIPADMREGCAVPLAIAGGFSLSPTVTLSIHSSRGQCTDPPTQSYGTITLQRTIAAGASDAGETDILTASFPSGPQLTRPAESQTPPTGYATNVIHLAEPGRSCPVPGYSQLSAGAIAVSGPNGSATVAPTTVAGSSTYSLNLPKGFVTGGAYTISAAGSTAIGAFQRSMIVDSPIQITAAQVPANIFGREPITVRWTGAAATSVVKVSLVYKSFLTEYTAYGYTAASAGSFSFQPLCTGNPISAGGSGMICGFGLPGLTEVVVEQMPAADQVSTFQTSGITRNIQVSWVYRYVIAIAQH